MVTWNKKIKSTSPQSVQEKTRKRKTKSFLLPIKGDQESLAGDESGDHRNWFQGGQARTRLPK